MKKEMFNVWYNEYGKELAKNALPIEIQKLYKIMQTCIKFDNLL